MRLAKKYLNNKWILIGIVFLYQYGNHDEKIREAEKWMLIIFCVWLLGFFGILREEKRNENLIWSVFENSNTEICFFDIATVVGCK